MSDAYIHMLIDGQYLSCADTHPSRFTQTETANKAARSFGLEEAPVPLKDSVAGLVKVVSQIWMASHKSLVPCRYMRLMDALLDRRVDKGISRRPISVL